MSVKQPFVILLLFLIIIVTLLMHAIFGPGKEGASSPAPAPSSQDIDIDKVNKLINALSTQQKFRSLIDSSANLTTIINNGLTLSSGSGEIYKYMATVYVCYKIDRNTINLPATIDSSFVKLYGTNIHPRIVILFQNKETTSNVQTNILKLVFGTSRLIDYSIHKEMLDILNTHGNNMRLWEFGDVNSYLSFVDNIINRTNANISIPIEFISTSDTFKTYCNSYATQPNPPPKLYDKFLRLLTDLKQNKSDYFAKDSNITGWLKAILENQVSVTVLLDDAKNLGATCNAHTKYLPKINIFLAGNLSDYKSLKTVFTNRKLAQYDSIAAIIQLFNDRKISVTDFMSVGNGNVLCEFEQNIKPFCKSTDIGNWKPLLSLVSNLVSELDSNGTKITAITYTFYETLQKYVDIGVNYENYADFKNNIIGPIRQYNPSLTLFPMFIDLIKRIGLTYNGAGADRIKQLILAHQSYMKSRPGFLSMLLNYDSTTKSIYSNKLNDFNGHPTEQQKVYRNIENVRTMISPDISSSSVVGKNLSAIIGFIYQSEYDKLKSSTFDSKNITLFMTDMAGAIDKYTSVSDKLQIVEQFKAFPCITFEYLQYRIKQSNGIYDNIVKSNQTTSTTSNRTKNYA